MRRFPASKKKKTEEPSKELHWKKRPSEISGYQRTIYINTENGDYLRVDYNLKEQRVRLYLEDGDEGGNPYYAVISNGKITAERNVTSGRNANLAEKFGKRASLFSTITNREILKIINKNYGIGEKTRVLDAKAAKKQEERERVKKKYFKPEDLEYQEKEEQRSWMRFRLVDVLDVVIGILLCTAVYLYLRSFLMAGLISALFGILIGLVDMFLRGRDPVFAKMIFFILAGLASYVYEYYIL